MDTKSEEQLIDIFDENGQKMQITRTEWKTRVLPDQIKKAWDNPEGLNQIILQSLGDGLFAEVLSACEHLHDLEKGSESSTILLGICFMKLNELDKSKGVYESFILANGETGTILVNLAKVYYEQKNESQGFDLLKKAVFLDPNMGNGVQWWAAIHKDKGGEKGYLDSLEELSRLKGSWYPSLWLARHALEAKDLSKAMKIYNSLPLEIFDYRGILMMISGDLGKNGFISEIISFIKPKYKPEAHGPQTGGNILTAFLNLGDFKQGLPFVRELYKYNWPQFREHLTYYEGELDKLSIAQKNMDESPRSTKDIKNLFLDVPISHYGLYEPNWIKPTLQKSDSYIVFLPLAALRVASKGESLETEDLSGILSRSIPLYLQESLFASSAYQGRIILPVMEGAGPILSGTPFEGSDMAGIFESQSEVEFCITGEISQQGKTLLISLYGFNRELERVEILNDFPFTPERAEAFFTELTKGINGVLDKADIPSPPASKAHMNYLWALNNGLLFTLIENKVMPYETMFGEPNILDNFMALVRNNPDDFSLKMLLVSSLSKASRFGSTNWKNTKEKIYKLIGQGLFEDDFASWLLYPIYFLFGDSDSPRPTASDKELLEWVERIT